MPGVCGSSLLIHLASVLMGHLPHARPLERCTRPGPQPLASSCDDGAGTGVSLVSASRAAPISGQGGPTLGTRQETESAPRPREGSLPAFLV